VKFGPVPLAEAAGCILAHSVRLQDGTLRKGQVLKPEDIDRLRASGAISVVVARLAPSDVAENVAAQRIAEALAGEGVEIGSAATGRVNLFARSAGLMQLDVPRIHAANAVHEGLTIATLHADEVVREGQMLATIKIIPYAVPDAALDTLIGCLDEVSPALNVFGWRGIRVALVTTRVADTRASVLTKMRTSVVKRLEPLNGALTVEMTALHEVRALAEALTALTVPTLELDLILVSGIAATVDREDVVPAAIGDAGGHVLHAGMPVDPGNLLVLAQLPRGDSLCPVIGIPTCARSPKLNGFDFVLRKIAAGVSVTAAHINSMGVGGLLCEIQSRPMPRGER
jgi:molybdenum cofactor cytidylyltransferase